LLLLALPAMLGKAQEALPVQSRLLLTYDVSSVVKGGVNTRSSHRALAQASLDFDTANLLLIPKSNVFISGQVFRGGNGSLDAGNSQTLSNIDAESFSKVYEY
jgi:hypothetical protein